MKKKVSLRIGRNRAGLVVIDIQERLLPLISQNERVIQNSVRLIKGCRILGCPTFVTEQYRKGLGATIPAITSAFDDFAALEKLAFSACGASGFQAALKAKKVSDVILCGIEAHVCVSQTCLDLLDHGLRVFVVVDAVSSGTEENHRLGIARMRDSGAAIVSTEMILFELLEQSGTDEFKQVLALVK